MYSPVKIPIKISVVLSAVFICIAKKGSAENAKTMLAIKIENIRIIFTGKEQVGVNY